MDGVIAATDYVYNKSEINYLAGIIFHIEALGPFYTRKCIHEHYNFIASQALAYIVVALYWLAILIGPTIMAKRKAIKLTKTIKVYNIIQLIFNSFMVYKYFNLMGISQGLRFWENSCSPALAANNFQLRIICDEIIPLMMLYLVNKILDLTETIFFILRKKNSQISFLHVFHHTALVLMGNISLHYGKEEVCLIMAVLNSIVHVIMYLYYFLASLGPSVQKMLWWKRYITRIQMIQFVIILGLFVKMLLYDGCEINKIFLVSWSVIVIIFLYLFTDFYVKAYSGKKK